jgi:hypothetical protein
MERNLKFCYNCRVYKSFNEFNKNRSKGDGYNNFCRWCMHQYHQDPINKNRRNLNDRRRRQNDPQYKITQNLRSRLNQVFKNSRKLYHTIKLLGCSPQFLKDWLEYQFYDGMSWENYGTHFCIDHVRPIASFDITNEEEQKICFNWKNLAPLTIQKNLRKSANRNIFTELMQEMKVNYYLSLIKNTENDYTE